MNSLYKSIIIILSVCLSLSLTGCKSLGYSWFPQDFMSDYALIKESQDCFQGELIVTTCTGGMLNDYWDRVSIQFFKESSANYDFSEMEKDFVVYIESCDEKYSFVQKNPKSQLSAKGDDVYINKATQGIQGNSCRKSVPRCTFELPLPLKDVGTYRIKVVFNGKDKEKIPDGFLVTVRIICQPSNNPFRECRGKGEESFLQENHPQSTSFPDKEENSEI